MFLILMLIVKDEEFDKVLGFEFGVDDYMIKLFSLREVNVRVKVILRCLEMVVFFSEMKNDEIEGQIVIGDLKILFDYYEVYFKENQFELILKEFELLFYLGRYKGRVLMRDFLLSVVWNYDFVGDMRIVDVYISYFCDKIENNIKKLIYIKMIRGLGYKLEELKMNE